MENSSLYLLLGFSANEKQVGPVSSGVFIENLVHSVLCLSLWSLPQEAATHLRRGDQLTVWEGLLLVLTRLSDWNPQGPESSGEKMDSGGEWVRHSRQRDPWAKDMEEREGWVRCESYLHSGGWWMLLPGRHCQLLHLKSSSFLESTVERAFYKLNASEVGKASTTFCICATTDRQLG